MEKKKQVRGKPITNTDHKGKQLTKTPGWVRMLWPKSASSSPALDTNKFRSAGCLHWIVNCWKEGIISSLYLFPAFWFLEQCLTGTRYSIHAWWKGSKNI